MLVARVSTVGRGVDPAGEAGQVQAQDRRVQRQGHLRGVQRAEEVHVREAAGEDGGDGHVGVGDAVVVGQGSDESMR